MGGRRRRRFLIGGNDSTWYSQNHEIKSRGVTGIFKGKGDVITWDDMGQVLLDGVLIPKSNISDLVSDAMRSRKHFNPVGVREFYNVLNKINVPKDLVRNEKRWGEAGKENVNEKTKELTIPEWISFKTFHVINVKKS